MKTASTEKCPIDGRWQLVRAKMGGEFAPELVTTNTELELNSGAYSVRFDGKITDRGAYEFNNTAVSKVLILRGFEGTNAGKTIPCLVQHVGDRLRICFGLDGVLPSDFEASKGMNRYLAKYKIITK